MMKSFSARTSRIATALLGLILALILPAARLAAQTIPNAVFASSQVVTAIAGNSGHVAVNTLGDVFYADTSSKTVYEIVHGTTTPVPIVTNVGSDQNVYIDPTPTISMCPGSTPARTPSFFLCPM